MPRGFVDDPEGDVADEKVDDGGFGYDILAADADGIDVLLLNVGQHHASAVTDDLCRGIDVKGVGCVPESLLHVRPERRTPVPYLRLPVRASPRAPGTHPCSRPQG